jgi:indole-3-glycerol phosphate synthase
MGGIQRVSGGDASLPIAGMTAGTDYLSPILERKRRENARRARRARVLLRWTSSAVEDRAAFALGCLRRAPGTAPCVIAEIKHRSPSAGVIRARAADSVAQLARQYERGGAGAVSVLCDRVGFGGSVLDVRRARAACSLPVLFKEFVLDDQQVTLARAVGAHMVVLLVRAMPEDALHALVSEVERQGMAPVVEAADGQELAVALRTSAAIVGVNARDLRSFTVDSQHARTLIERIPAGRIAVHMSGVRCVEDLTSVASSRADAVLIGEGLMRASDPEALLRQWLTALPPTGTHPSPVS